MADHEYALLGGINRSNVGRYIGAIAAAVSAGIVFITLTFVDLATRFGFPVNLPPTFLSLIGAGMVFLVLYALFNKYVWRWPLIGPFLRVPDLGGEWDCKGTTYNRTDNSVRNEWTGKVTIVQSWDKIRVRLKTAQSGSNSITAALTCDDVDGFILLYNYRNDPHPIEPELRPHTGFGKLVFAKDRQSAEGEYFNGFGRDTFGLMKLTRI